MNPSKYQTTIVGSQCTLHKLEELTITPIIFNVSIISVSQMVKNLGLLMDPSLSWQAHVTSMSQRLADFEVITI